MKSEEQKRLEKHLDKADKVGLMSTLGTVLGYMGAIPLQKYLGNILSKNHKEIKGPLSFDVPDLKKSGLGRNAGALSESFIKEKGLRDAGIKINLLARNKLSDYYNPIRNTVNLSTASDAVALHELGHANDIRGSLLKTIGRKLPQAMMATGIPLALTHGHEIKKDIPGTVDDKVIDFVQKNPITTGLAGYGLATLYPEAKASYYALKHIYDKKGFDAMKGAFTKSLGPAYGTYLAGALPVIAGVGLAKYMSKDLYEKKASLSPNTKAFLTGASILGIPSTMMARYYLGDSGGKTLRKIQRAKIDRQIRKLKQTKPLFYQSSLKVLESQKKDLESTSSHKNLKALATGIPMAILGGAITAAQMKKMP